MNAGGRAVLVPPRPNLGPESLKRSPEDLASFLIVFLMVLSALTALLLGRGALRTARRLVRRGRSRTPRESGSISTGGGFDSPRDALIACSDSLRSTLASCFGPAWNAMTTEEIARRPELTDRLGDVRTERLIDFLARADRAKFADPASPDLPDPASYSGWAADLVRELSPAEGARSRIIGK